MSLDIKKLLTRYREIKSLPIGSSVTTNQIKDLLEKVNPLLSKIKEENKISTPHYNFFRILKIGYLEAKVHTPFLVNLLNPDGTHAQGRLFLDAFLELLSENDQRFTNYLPSNIEIKAEYKTNKGIIDIIISHRHPESKKSFLIIIENKIFAGDQENQIERYYHYALNELKLSEEQITIVYLTPKQFSPSEYSINLELMDKLRKQGRLKLLGYNSHITKMLSKCNEQVLSEKLRQTINQYLEILNDFTDEN
jgi:hypothetical protein